MSIAGPIVSTDPLPEDVLPSAIDPVHGTAHVRLPGGWKAMVATCVRVNAGSAATESLTLTPAQWRQWLAEPLGWMALAQGRDVLKTSSTTAVCRVRLSLDDGRSLDAVFKRGHSRHLRKRLLSCLRVSRPRRTWRRAHLLMSRRLPTARPLAVLERRRFGLLLDSVYVTEFLPNAVDLESLLTVRMRDLSPGQARRLKTQLAELLARFITQFLGGGLYHRDLKALNVIVQWDAQRDDPPRISVVDLDGVKRSLLGHGHGWQRMLMRLNVSVDGFKRVSLTDRLRLLRHFLRMSRLGPTDWKVAWRELAALSERKREVRSRQQERAFRKYGRY